MKQKQAEDPSVVYSDIIDLPHHKSDKHPHMSLYDRAAQFAPFAALSGYDDMVREEARYTEKREQLSESQADNMNRKLSVIQTELVAGRHPELTFLIFIPDKCKEGGSYRSISGRVKRIDFVRRRAILYDDNGISDGMNIILDDAVDIYGALVDALNGE